VRWRQGSGGYGLITRYSGPGVNKSVIPDNVLKKPEVNATTLSLPPSPNAPGNFVVTAVSDTQIDLSWTDVSSDEDYFEIYRSVGNNSNFALLETVEANSTRFSNEGLFTNVTYYYYVNAVNVGGRSSTAEQSAKTLNNPPLVDQIDDITLHYDNTLEINIYASDEDQEALTFSVTGLPAFGTLNDYGDGSGLLSFTPSSADQGIYNLTLTVEDENGGTDASSFVLTVNDQVLPIISTVAEVSVAEGTTNSVNVEVSNQTELGNLMWETENFPSFASLSTNADGSATVTFSPDYASGGRYEDLIVRSVDQTNGTSSEKNFSVTISEADPNISVLVNFRHSLNAPSPWNNISSLGATSLNDTEGGASGISLELLTTAWNTYNDGAQSGTNSGFFPNSVLKDYYFFGIFGAPETVTMKLSGLSPSVKYNFSFVSSSIWSGRADNGTTVYTINNESKGVYVQGNTSNVASFTAVTPNAEGEILITASKGANTAVGYLNGFELKTAVGIDELPATPRDLLANMTGQGVELSWIDAPFNEEGFKVYRSESAEGPFVQINTSTIAADAETYTDKTAIEGVGYYYTVTSYNANGESAYSNVVSFLVPNTSPKISVDGLTTIYANNVSSLDINVTDPPLDQVELTVNNLPSFANFTSTTDGGTIALSPTKEDIGTYVIQVEARDDKDAVSTYELSITVEEEVLYSVSLNFSSNSNQASPWNNTRKAPAINDIFGNLINQSGNNSGISVQLLTSFGGVYNQGAVTGNNTGIVPDNVLREYYWFGYNGAPNEVRVKVAGLDNTKKYTFKFVASSLFNGSGITDNGETVYIIGSKSASLDVQGNTQNLARIENVIANENGEVLVKMQKGNGASVGYINAMIVEAYAADANAFNPDNLAGKALDKSSVSLSWSDNSPSELGFEVYRSADGSPGSFTLLSTTQANVSSISDTGLKQGGTYYYKVRAKYSENEFSEFSSTVNVSPLTHFVYVNVNGDPSYNQAAPWNNLGLEATTGDIFTGFHNDKGNPTGMALEVVNGMNGNNDWGTTTGNDSGVYPDKVMKSFYFNDRFSPKGEFKLKGLDQGFNYNIKFFGAIVTNLNISTWFRAGGQAVLNRQTNNTQEVVTIYGLEPDEEGNIQFEVQEDASSNWAIFNAFVVEAYPVGSELAARTTDKSGKPIVGNHTVFYENADIASIQEVPVVFPNPATDRLSIEFSAEVNDRISISLSNALGVTVLEYEHVGKLLNKRIDLNEKFSDLNSGLYLLKIKKGQSMHIYKIVKK
jgi:hypothetical protein